MKFKSYISDFRNLGIGLVDKTTGHKQLARRIKEEFNVEKDVVNAIDDLNRLLNRRIKFDLVMGESVNGEMIEKKFKIKKKAMDKLKIKLLESGDMLAGMKSLPVWAASDEGRLVYDTVTNEMYVGNDSTWVSSSSIPTGTVMWFYQVSAPSGWTIEAEIATDTMLGVKSSGGTLSVSNHNHKWYDYSGGQSYTWASDGSTQIVITGSGTASTQGLLSRVTSADSWRFPTDGYTIDSTAGVAGSTATNSLNTARPYTYVGILATKD